MSQEAEYQKKVQQTAIGHAEYYESSGYPSDPCYQTKIDSNKSKSFTEGVAWCRANPPPEVTALVEAANKIGVQCSNTGMYGPLKIRPGECPCANCEMRKARDAFNACKGEWNE